MASLCASEGYIVVKADIANYFERIPQHHLVNLMSAARCPPEVVNLLEEMLLAFKGRNSFGILQGMFPSDVLGNFFLSEFDGYCDIHMVYVNRAIGKSTTIPRHREINTYLARRICKDLDIPPSIGP